MCRRRVLVESRRALLAAVVAAPGAPCVGRLVTTPTGLALRCPRCRTQTPGWTLDAAPPTRRFAGARRPKVRIGWLTNTGTSRLRD
jgi:hypothetical protein